MILHGHGLRLREIVGFLPPRLLVPELLVARGLFEIRRGRPGQAIAHFARVCEEYQAAPAAPEALYWLGVAADWHHGDKTRLWAAWRELARRYPDSLWAAKVVLPDGER